MRSYKFRRSDPSAAATMWVEKVYHGNLKNQFCQNFIARAWS
jgi:hypothetical protein